MKATVLVSLLAMLLPASAQTKAPPADSKNGPPVEDLQPNQKAFLNLPEERRKEWLKHLTEANRIFQQKRIIETSEELDKAAAIFKDSAELHNLRGSCYVEMRAFEKALVEFRQALEFAKDNANIEFNIGEVYFVTKQWPKCVDMFGKVLKDIPPDKSLDLRRLVEFKIRLAQLKLGKLDEAKVIAAKYDDLDDSPFYYYAQASMAFEKNDQIKAEEWLQMAARIFRDPNATAPWRDTITEYGYIKSVYGNELSMPDDKDK